MIRIGLRSLLSHKLRTALTTLAILLGVAMISGTYVLTDQIKAGFDNIFRMAVKGADVIVAPKAPVFGQQSGTTPQYLSARVLTQVRQTPGVARADGFVTGLAAVTIDGKVVTVQNGPPTLVFSTVRPPFTQNVYTAGRPPREPGEVSVTTSFATDHGLKPGATLGIVTTTGEHEVRLVGTFDFGNAGSLGGVAVVDGVLSDVQAWYDAAGKLSAVYATAEPGVKAATLSGRLRAALPTGIDIKTGEQSAAEQSKALGDVLNKIVTPALLAFGALAVLVGAFIIFNAFSITVAQRLREFAMLRALGATRRQVLGTVVMEALAIGGVASVAGLFSGLGVAVGVNAVFAATGSELPQVPATLHARTVLIALLVGVSVTLLAALVPALRATRVPPVAALQEGATLPPSRLSRLTPYAAGLTVGAGAVAIALGALGGGGLARRLLLLGLGALFVFVAAGMMAKHAVRPLAAALGWPLERLSASTGRLARENAARNPARTGATAAALMIGLAVVVFVAVFAQALKSSFVDTIDRSVRADLIVTSGYAVPLPSQGVEAIRRLPWVAAATGVVTQPVRIGARGTDTLIAVDPGQMGYVWRFQWIGDGTDKLIVQLGRGEVIVEQQVAQSHGLRVGGSLSLLTQAGKTAKLKVIGEYRAPAGLSGIVVSNALYDTLYPQRDSQLVLVKTIPGQDVAALQTAAQKVLDRSFPTAKVQTRQEYTDSVTKQVDQLLLLIYALLAMSVIISVFGIVNTLVLTVYERTRELGMLRAIGASRRQIRRMVRYESVITAVIGGVLGIVIGVVFAFLLVSQLGSEGITFALPGLQLVYMLVASAAVGIIAAVLPARRAARVDILAAIHYE